MADQKVYTVAEICDDIKSYVGGNPEFVNILVEGEVSNLSDPNRVHLYFTLRDKDTKAILPVAMFGWKEKVGAKLPIKDKESVCVYGNINIYADRGQYQLIARRLFPQGAGILDKKLEALKEKLEAEGLFDKAHKRPIPKYASRIGIVTSDSGDIIGDIKKRALAMNPYVQLILYPSLVQGAGAAQNMAEGIREMQHHAVDVIIVGRGGGPDQDFSSFNEEVLARAIYESNVPVITAIGHNTNSTISDLVADRSVITPTEAADLAVFDVWDVMQSIDRMNEDLNRRMTERKKQAEVRTENYKLKLETKSPDKILSERRGRVKEYERLLEKKNPALRVQEWRTAIKGYEGKLAERNPVIRIRECRKRVEDTGTRLSGRMERICNDMKYRVQLKSKDLEASSPLKKLESGYAFLARADGMRISRVDGLSEGDRIRAYMRDGSFAAVIDEVKTDAEVKGKNGKKEGE